VDSSRSSASRGFFCARWAIDALSLCEGSRERGATNEPRRRTVLLLGCMAGSVSGSHVCKRQIRRADHRLRHVLGSRRRNGHAKADSFARPDLARVADRRKDDHEHNTLVRRRGDGDGRYLGNRIAPIVGRSPKRGLRQFRGRADGGVHLVPLGRGFLAATYPAPSAYLLRRLFGCLILTTAIMLELIGGRGGGARKSYVKICIYMR